MSIVIVTFVFSQLLSIEATSICQHFHVKYYEVIHHGYLQQTNHIAHISGEYFVPC